MSSSGSGMFLFLSFFLRCFAAGGAVVVDRGGRGRGRGWPEEEELQRRGVGRQRTFFFVCSAFFVSVYLGLMICGIFFWLYF